MTKERQFCNTCDGYTLHELLGEPITHSAEPITWLFWQCCGCEDVFLLKQVYSVYGDNEDEEGTEESEEPICERIPPQIAYRLPSWINDISENIDDSSDTEFAGQVDTSIKQLMTEIYTALNHNAFNLACTGLRTVLDCVFFNQLGTNVRVRASFEEKLQAMVEQGLISTQAKDKLTVVIDVGNASAHRGWTPPPKILSDAIQITEHLLQELYIHPRGVESLRAITPAVR